MSSSDSDPGNASIISAIARSADAVIQLQQVDVRRVSSTKRKAREEGGEIMGLDHLQVKLRKALDDRLERNVLQRFKRKMNGDHSGEAGRGDRCNGNAKDLGAEEIGSGVRLFRKVPVGTPAILETQSTLRERAESDERRKNRVKDLKSRSKGSSASSSEDEAMKKSLDILAVGSNYILRNAEIAREKAAKNVVDADIHGVDAEGKDFIQVDNHTGPQDQETGEKRRKKRIKEKKRKKRKKEEKKVSEAPSEPG